MFGLMKKIFMGLLISLVNAKSCKIRFVKQSEMYDSTYSY